MFSLPQVERYVIASFHDYLPFELGDRVTTYGIIAVSEYCDENDERVQCFAMEVMDYVADYTREAIAVHIDPTAVDFASYNAGPIDWDQIPKVCYDMWVGKDRVFGTGNGYWYRITPEKAAGCPYTVKYWKYDPMHNRLSIGVTFDWAGEGTYVDDTTLTWIDFCDAHIMVQTSGELDRNILSGNYVHENLEYYMLWEAIGNFYGSTMFWPDSE